MKEHDTYHAWILTKDRKFFDGSATATGGKIADGFQIGVNREAHPNVSENQLLQDMAHVLVDFTKQFEDLDERN